MDARAAWGWGLVSETAVGIPLDAWFPTPALGTAPTDPAAAGTGVPTSFDDLLGPDDRRAVIVTARRLEIDLDAAPVDVPDVFLRLHLLSHCLVKPNEVNLDGIQSLLPVTVWSSIGPLHPDDYARLAPALRRSGVVVHGLDKFPRMLDYVVPPRVRVADAARARLGAHLAPGTTVMHAGFVNYNAGTLGASMVEGRISQGVVVGDGSDVGGGASIMGTLSGGGRERVAIGERSLLGANSGLGIAIGDDCVVEAGLYLTAGTKLELLSPDAPPRPMKAVELSGVSGLLFRRNSLTGAVEAVPRAGVGVTLNAALHA